MISAEDNRDSYKRLQTLIATLKLENNGFHTGNKSRESKLQPAQTLWIFDAIITEIIVPTTRLGALASASGNTAPKAPAAN
jgi:hypothetical protein